MSEQEALSLDENKLSLLKRSNARKGSLGASIALNVVLSLALLVSMSRTPSAAETGVTSLAQTPAREPFSKPLVTCQPTDADSCDCDGEPVGNHAFTPPSWWSTPLTSIYQATALMGGTAVSLAKYKAKATIVVNVASA